MASSSLRLREGSMTKVSTADYLNGAETMRRRELLFGQVHEPASPRYGHQAVITRLVVLLDGVVRDRHQGVVCVSPMDVVFDSARALVLQPDLMFISTERRALIRDRVYGAPDLVVEVLSMGSARRDRGLKLRLYRKYGVRECWLVSEHARRVEVVSFDRARTPRRIFAGNALLQSSVFGQLPFAPIDVFEAC